jgi:hypothetical protein
MSPKPRPAAGDAEQLLAALDHPQKAAILAVRDLIKSAHPDIREGVKWNAPSYALRDDFATFQLRHKGVQLVLHLGVKARPDATLQRDVADPDGLLEWRGADRATVTFADLADVQRKQQAFLAVLQQWIAYANA